ncbi:glycoside hydrolase family 88 protein [Bacillota bacterium HCP3S3_F1_1]
MQAERETILEKMAEEAGRELHQLAHQTWKRKAKSAAKRLLGRKEATADLLFWPAGLLLLGLVEADHLTEAEDYLDLWFDRGMPVGNPDDALAGAVMLRLFERTGKERYLQAADRIFDYLERCRRDPEGAIVYGQRSKNDWIYADGAGQTCLFYSEYARVTGERGREAISLAERQMSLFLKNGMDERSGLPYHGYDEKSGVKFGIIGWGRAVGWLLLGLSGESLQEMGNPEITARTERLLGEILERIREDHLFSWQLDCLEGPADTSATGMICYSLLQMKKTGNSEKVKRALEQAAEKLFSMVSEDGKIGQASAECTDFAQYRQQYGNYPWGQGAVLVFLACFVRK